jgi:hypothetical protein
VVVVRALQQTSHQWLDAYGLEVLSAHFRSPDGLSRPIGLEAEDLHGFRGNSREYGTAIAHANVRFHRLTSNLGHCPIGTLDLA